MPLWLISYDLNNKPSRSIVILRGASEILRKLYSVSSPVKPENQTNHPLNPSETIEVPRRRKVRDNRKGRTPAY